MGEDGHDETITELSPHNGVQERNLSIENNDHSPAGTPDGALANAAEGASEEEQRVDNVFSVTIMLPHQPYEISIMVSTQEQVQDLRQSIMEAPGSFQYSCFHLEHMNTPINDFMELSEISGLAAGSTLKLVEDPYTEKEARVHLLRTREIIGAANERTDGVYGVSAGLSLHDTVCPLRAPEGKPLPNGVTPGTGISGDAHALDSYDLNGRPCLRTLLPLPREPAPKTVKSIGVSAWNPPPQFLRQKGHLLYLHVTTNEGEQYQITSHISGFFVNKSSNSKFDPYPRPAPKNAFAHSLFSLVSALSPSFSKSFELLQEMNNKRDPLANFQLTIPSAPWLVPLSATSLGHHQPDLTRTQETYLLAGADNTETLRDWNEEIQNTKEMARDSIQDRVFRERLMSKLYAEFNDAAVHGAVLVARGEVPPLNPTETCDAQIFVYNNVFYSFGADGVGTFASEGGDEAARVAVGKDVTGVKAVNQLDIDKLATAATIIVDYLGKRLVAQSIVPGIFKQREPEENQVDYGGVEGRDVVADNEAFVPAFSQLSKELRVKKHPVWDKKGKEHVLEASVETKGLLGTDGRKYILDLYRLTPLDILWLEEHGTDRFEAQDQTSSLGYPHRMTVLRPELIDAYWRLKLSEYVNSQIENRKVPIEANGTTSDLPNGKSDENGTLTTVTTDHEKVTEVDGNADSDSREHVDISAFSLAFNPDVFCGQVPQTAEQKEEWAKDEEDVRELCQHLHNKILPDLLHDLKEGEVGFPMDGHSLSALMHKRGINIRYLGKLATLAQEDNSRMLALKALATQEMIARAFKHVVNRYMKNLPFIFAPSCVAHLLNCLLGSEINGSPKAHSDEDTRSLYPEANFSFTALTPKTLRKEVEDQVDIRYRVSLSENWIQEIKHVQLLRNVALKLGLQLVDRDYSFSMLTDVSKEQSKPLLNGKSSESDLNGHTNANGNVNGQTKSGKKKKKNAGRNSPTLSAGSDMSAQDSTFSPDDIANIVPIVKDSCPKSRLAEEALEAGKISMMQNQKDVGQELLLESLTLHEQIYGILHPEVARVYHQLAMLYYQLDEKNAAIELAHKAVIISERTLGVDSSETVLAYLNLALFEHGNRNTPVAIACVRHALELWKIIYGVKHPDSITTLNNAAVMLQQLQFYKESRLWFEMSLSISEEVSGKQSVNTATLLFQLAQALVLDNDHNGAVHRMREAYSVFLAKLGKEDPNTKESEKWLDQLTQNAVSMAKQAKDVQARRSRRIMLHPRPQGLGAHPQPQVGQSSTALLNGDNRHGSRGLDSRSIEELLRFIEGGAQSSRTTPKKRTPGRGNPRRRVGSIIGASA